MMGTRSSTLGMMLGGGLGVEAEGLFAATKGELKVTGLVDASEARLRRVERLANEKVDASECRIEALLLRGSVAAGVVSVRGEPVM
jgi:hypothetical protein